MPIGHADLAMTVHPKKGAGVCKPLGEAMIRPRLMGE